jgi:hypothetical protein
MIYVNLSLSLSIAFLRLFKTINRFIALYFINEYNSIYNILFTRYLCIGTLLSAILFFAPFIISPSNFYLHCFYFILVFDSEFGIDLLAGTGFFGMGYGRIFGIRDGIDSRIFGTGFEKKIYLGPPFSFFRKFLKKT